MVEARYVNAKNKQEDKLDGCTMVFMFNVVFLTSQHTPYVSIGDHFQIINAPSDRIKKKKKQRGHRAMILAPIMSRTKMFST